jgi:hypothetical protein
MSKLTAATRNKRIPFNRTQLNAIRVSFPIEDKGHARAALSRVSDKSPAVKAEVRGKVKRKFPEIGRRGAPKYPKIAGEYVK